MAGYPLGWLVAIQGCAKMSTEADKNVPLEYGFCNALADIGLGTEHGIILVRMYSRTKNFL